jgi:SapC
MPDHQILTAADHGRLRVRTEAGAEFGDGVMASLAVPAEFRRLACEYPILFRFDPASQGFSALALFGFEAGENLFLADGRWDASCKPLAMRVQPFLVGRSATPGGPSQIHIDRGHPRISTSGEGVRLFDDGGQPTPLVEEVGGLLGVLDEGYQASGAFLAALDRHGLLEPFSMDVTLDSGAMHRLVGYHMVAEERLRALDPAALIDLHAEGHLEPLYMAVASIGNLAKLVRRKNRRAIG